MVSIETDALPVAEDAIAAAFQRIEQIHRLMSFHEPDSDLRRLARARPGEILEIHADTHAVLMLAQRLEADSDGAFNACCAAALVERGLLPRPADTPTASASSLRGGLALLTTPFVRVVSTCWIDLGGIAKGYAVDAAIETLQSAGATSGLVNAGGDLHVFGRRTLTVQMRDPHQPWLAWPLAEISDMACATSAKSNASWGDGGQPSTIVGHAQHVGENAPVSVSVFASTCALADALTKVVWLRRAAARPLLQAYGAEALVWSGEGRTERF